MSSLHYSIRANCTDTINPSSVMVMIVIHITPWTSTVAMFMTSIWYFLDSSSSRTKRIVNAFIYVTVSHPPILLFVHITTNGYRLGGCL